MPQEYPLLRWLQTAVTYSVYARINFLPLTEMNQWDDLSYVGVEIWGYCSRCFISLPYCKRSEEIIWKQKEILFINSNRDVICLDFNCEKGVLVDFNGTCILREPIIFYDRYTLWNDALSELKNSVLVILNIE